MQEDDSEQLPGEGAVSDRSPADWSDKDDLSHVEDLDLNFDELLN